MITGILVATPEGEFFNNVVVELQLIADTPVDKDLGTEKLRLPQVHALNCLKDIFSDSRFGGSVEGHVANTLTIAVLCLDHET